MISIVVCSAKPPLLAALKKNIEDSIGTPYELIAIDNSNGKYGICKAYNEGGAKAKYPFICFMHEDISFDTRHWGRQLIQHFADRNTGLVGIAGGDAKSMIPSSWSSPMISNEINIFQHFRAENTPPRHLLETCPPAPATKKKVVALDGVWLCTRKEIFAQYQFDEKTFPGFHGYDIDYSLQLQRKYDCYVIFDIVVHHFSEGRPDRTWMDSAIRLSSKWKKTLPVSAHDTSNTDFFYHHWRTMQIFLDHLFRLRYSRLTILRSWIRWSCTRYFSFRRFGSMGKHILHAMRQRLPLLIWLLSIALAPTCKKTAAHELKTLGNNTLQGTRYLDDVFPLIDTSSYNNILFRVVKNFDTLNHLALDVYQPAGDTLSHRPALVLFHGGGFNQPNPAVSGDSLTRKDPILRMVCIALAKKGYVVISPSYRVGQNYSRTDTKADSINKYWEACYRATQDARAAIRFIRKNCSYGHLDSNRLFVGGGSAGAFIAVNTIYLDSTEVPASFITNWGRLDGQATYDYPDISTRVKGLLNIEGVIADTSWIKTGSTPLLNLYGDKDPFYKDAVNAGSPPFTFGNGKSMHARATHQGVPSQLNTYPGGTHGSVYDNTHLATTISTISNWLYQQLP